MISSPGTRQALFNFRDAALKLSEAWEINKDYDNELSVQYPFTEDFNEVVDKIMTWVEHHTSENSKYYPEPLGRKVNVKPGKYEIIDYGREGPSHSETIHNLDKNTEGLIIEEVWEGCELYNFLFYDDKEGANIIIVVEPSDIIDKFKITTDRLLQIEDYIVKDKP